MKYLISAVETAPSTGHKHIHIYVQFTNARNLDLKKCCGAHIENCRGTPQQNRNYIIKDGNVLDEIGEFYQQGGFGGRSIKDIMDMDYEDVIKLDFRYFNILQKIKKNTERLLIGNKKKDLTVYYLYGPSGIGKSHTAKKLLEHLAVPGTPYDDVKYDNGFWIGMHENTDYCIYDDFRDTDVKPNEFIKFIDYNYHVHNIKGGEIIPKYKTIIITSIKSPWELYHNKSDEEKYQWIRRMKIYTYSNNKWEYIDSQVVYDE